MENAGQDPAGQQAQGGTQQAAADPQQAQGGSDGKDYKALYEDAVKESRKWEKRSKDNLEQLNALKQSQGKPDPTIEERIAALAKPQGGAPLVPEAGQKQKPGKPSKKEILGIEDKKERMAAIAANIDLFK